MIELLTQSLGQILTKYLAANTAVRYDRMNEGSLPGVPTINLFLYDIREDKALQSNEPLFKRNNGGYTATPPPLRVACTYLVTAWCGTKEDDVLAEQKLLDQALMAFAKHPTIPAEFLVGDLSGQDPPVPLMTSLLDGVKNPVEFWTVVGYKLRPALTVTATISMQLTDLIPTGMVTSVVVDVSEKSRDAQPK
jgi:hypothetical protein